MKVKTNNNLLLERYPTNTDKLSERIENRNLLIWNKE